MPSGGTTAAVHRYLDGDGAAQDMLDRGVLNVRAFARWLIDSQEWDTTEEAVVSALRRYSDRRDGNAMAAARRLLEEAWINSRSDVCSLALPRTLGVRKRLDALFDVVDPGKGEMLHIVEGERAIKVLVACEKLDAVREALRVRDVLYVAEGLAEYSVSCPEEAHRTPGVLAILHNALATHRINVVESVCGGMEVMLFVKERDSLKAFQVLNGLVGDGP